MQFFLNPDDTFSCISRDAIWRTVTTYNILQKHIDCIKMICQDANGYVRRSTSITNEFSVKVGEHQGSVLCSLLNAGAIDTITATPRARP